MIEILGLLVASVAVIATIVDHWRQRRHDRLTVQPNVGFDRDFKDGIAFVEIVNRGFGPAQIANLLFATSVSRTPKPLSTAKAIAEVIPSLEKGMPLSTQLPSPGANLAVGERKRILYCDCNAIEDPDSKSQAAHKSLSTLMILINYESIYKERFSSFTPGRDFPQE